MGARMPESTPVGQTSRGVQGNGVKGMKSGGLERSKSINTYWITPVCRARRWVDSKMNKQVTPFKECLDCCTISLNHRKWKAWVSRSHRTERRSRGTEFLRCGLSFSSGFEPVPASDTGKEERCQRRWTWPLDTFGQRWRVTCHRNSRLEPLPTNTL